LGRILAERKFSPIQNSPTSACLEKINRKKNLLEHFGLFVDQQGVAGVADSQRLRRTGKFHLVVTATITEDAPAIPAVMFSPCYVELFLAELALRGLRVLCP